MRVRLLAIAGAVVALVVVVVVVVRLALNHQSLPDLNELYRTASPGQVFHLPCGSYSDVTIDRVPGRSGAPVVFVGSSCVHLGRLVISADSLEIDGVDVRGWKIVGADGVTLRDVSSDGALYVAGDASDVRVIGGQVYSSKRVTSDSQITLSHDVLFDRVRFHDWIDSLAGGVNHHIECLQVGAADGLVVENSSFRDCYTHDIFVRAWGHVGRQPTPLRGIVIRHDLLARTVSGLYSMQLIDDLLPASERPSSALVAGNAVGQGIAFRFAHGRIAFSGNRYVGFSSYSCSVGKSRRGGALITDNVYRSGVVCGHGDRVDPRVDLAAVP